MTLQIELPVETESKLREQAAAAGKDPAVLALEAIQEKLARVLSANGGTDPSGDWESRFEAFIGRARDWANRNLPRPHTVDTSRESIYPDRGA